MDLRRLASQLLARYSLRDPAPTIETWNTQYSTGRWTFVGQLWELSRFSVLVGYLRHFARGGAILDVGCGQGFLPQRLQPDDYKRYVGIDFSDAAIDKAIELRLPKATFSAVNAQVHVPAETFDAIVFTEVLYYLSDPLRTVERYARALNKDGVLLVSTNTTFRGGLAIHQALKRHYPTLDETWVTHEQKGRSWVCTVLSGVK